MMFIIEKEFATYMDDVMSNNQCVKHTCFCSYNELLTVIKL